MVVLILLVILFVGSNPSVGITNPGNTSICTGSSLTFPITYTNSPGTIYTVTFNDGTAPVNFNPASQTSITHIFNLSSCGTTSQASQTYQNSFSASVNAINPCSQSSGTVVPIYVSEKATPAFTISPKDTICINTVVTLTNTTGSIKTFPQMEFVQMENQHGK
jgi:hypothetical protein